MFIEYKVRKLQSKSGFTPTAKRVSWEGKPGFTLVEILIVIALLVLLIIAVSIPSIRSYRSYGVTAERDTFLNLLFEARGKAMNTIDSSSHGVRIGASSFILFSGPSFESGHEKNFVTERNADVVITGPEEIIFEKLSGNPSFAGTFTLRGGGITKTISIHDEGQIAW